MWRLKWEGLDPKFEKLPVQIYLIFPLQKAKHNIYSTFFPSPTVSLKPRDFELHCVVEEGRMSLSFSNWEREEAKNRMKNKDYKNFYSGQKAPLAPNTSYVRKIIVRERNWMGDFPWADNNVILWTAQLSVCIKLVSVWYTPECSTVLYMQTNMLFFSK